MRWAIDRGRATVWERPRRIRQKVIQTLSDALNTEFGKGFSVDTLENARKFLPKSIRIEFPKQCFGNC